MAAGAPGSKIQLEDIKQSVTCGICLQLYTDPRVLTCNHTYCLTCLQGFQKSSNNKKNCPQCRDKSIPIKQELIELPANNLANQLVELVHQHEPDTREEAPKWNEPGGGDSGSDSGDEEFESLDDRVSGLLRLLRGDSLEQFASLLRLFGNDEDTSADSGGGASGQVRHPGVTCDACKKGIVGACFKCGNCDDFDLCEECMNKPRMSTHPTDFPHVFVKLKKPRLSTPDGAFVKEEAQTMAMTMDVTKTEHIACGEGGRVLAVFCSHCKKSPISGFRYKCGVCADYDLCGECEKKSEDIHDADHVFLVFKHPTAFHTTEPQLTHNFY